MALARTWKSIYAEGDDILVARHLCQRIVERFSGTSARGTPVYLSILDDSEELFVAVTNCGWDWLDREAWAIGRPGTHRYVLSMANWDQETIDELTDDAQQISR